MSKSNIQNFWNSIPTYIKEWATIIVGLITGVTIIMRMLALLDKADGEANQKIEALFKQITVMEETRTKEEGYLQRQIDKLEQSMINRDQERHEIDKRVAVLERLDSRISVLEALKERKHK